MELIEKEKDFRLLKTSEGNIIMFLRNSSKVSKEYIEAIECGNNKINEDYFYIVFDEDIQDQLEKLNHICQILRDSIDISKLYFELLRYDRISENDLKNDVMINIIEDYLINLDAIDYLIILIDFLDYDFLETFCYNYNYNNDRVFKKGVDFCHNTWLTNRLSDIILQKFENKKSLYKNILREKKIERISI